jgi:hypothetical protein
MCFDLLIFSHLQTSIQKHVKNFLCYSHCSKKFVESILCFIDRASLYDLVSKDYLVHNFSELCLFLFSTCFIQPCIPDSHPYRITSTKCRINTVVSPDDGHIVARNT